MTVCQTREQQAAFHTPETDLTNALPNRREVGSNDRREPCHLSSVEFSTEGLPRIHQFEAWRDNFASILELKASRNIVGGFTGKQVIWDLGCFAFSQVRTDALEFESLALDPRRELLDHFVLSVLLSGDACTIAPARTVRVGVGVAQVHSLSRHFRGNLTDCEMLMLYVPRDFCPQVTQALSIAEFTTLDSGMGHLFHDFMVGLAKQLPTVERVALPALVVAARAMILASVSPSADHLEAADHLVMATLLDRAQKHIQSRLFDSTLGARLLGRELGISRSRLYRLFEPFGGVRRYIQHRRLLDAHAALANPNDRRRVLDIAEQRCFTDGTEFSRAFKREFGYSPTEVRNGQRNNFACARPANLQDHRPENHLEIILRKLHG